jgi:hypothetical protein
MRGSRFTLVEIPEDKGIHLKATGRNRLLYVYKYTNHYSTPDGKKHHEATIIGKYDENTGKMFPNKNFFIFYPIESTPLEIEYYHYGFSYLVSEVANELGLTKILVDIFGDVGYDIVTIAGYIIRNGNSIDGIYWLKETLFPIPHSNVTSPKCSKIFTDLDITTRTCFLKKWLNKHAFKKHVYYDITSILTYCDEIIESERGYNRDGEVLNKHNIGIFCDKDYGIPLYYELYNDKIDLPYVLQNAMGLKINDVDIFINESFWSSKSFKMMNEISTSFIIETPTHYKQAEETKTANTQIPSDFKYNLGLCNIVGIFEDATIHNINGKFALYYDEKLDPAMQEEETNLQNMKTINSDIIKDYYRHFIIKQDGNDARFSFIKDIKKADRFIKDGVYFSFFTNDTNSSLDQIFKYYRQKNLIENVF